MNIVYPICCGVDVHKKTIVATIVTTDEHNVSTYLQKSFSTFNYDLQNFHDWLIQNNCYHVCMESTGKYWIPIFNVLESDIHVVLTHPKYVKAIKGNKTDKKDSKWIADLFKFDMVRGSFIPPKSIRDLREISRYRFKLVCMRSSERNRIQNSMTISNIGLASVISDPFGVTANNILDYLISSPSFDPKECEKLIVKRAKHKSSEIIKSIEGYNLQPDQLFKISKAKSHLEYLEQLICDSEVELYARVQPYDEIIERIAKLPGFSKLSAMLVISEIGVDMSVFESSKHLTSWAGLTPTNNESAGKKKSVRISHAGQYLKPLLVQCALSAVKSKKEPYFAIKYNRLKKRRGHKKAIIAIARMMLTCIYHMIKSGQDFNPTDYKELTNPKFQTSKVELTVETALQFLASKGLDVSSLTSTI